MSAEWWGTFEFGDDETRHWRLGPFAMWITRRAAEFRIATRTDPAGDPLDVLAGGTWNGEVPQDADLVRYGVRETVRKVDVRPLAADRAVIVKSETTYVLPPGGSATAFISTPVWLQVQLASPLRPLFEIPTQRPSDTWFGPSTLAGELCYAVRTSVRYDLANLPVRPFRAVSVVRILNHADSPLPLARLRLPLPGLSLYAGRQGRLWTESVTLDREEDGDLAAIKLGKAAPREAGTATRVCGPRAELDRQSLIRSFTGLLGLSSAKGKHERVVE